MEIVARLRAVTQGAPASELSLKRNSLGQLGFHVQPDGVVTQVESMGLSWQAGLRQASRLVEICKVAVSTLSHDQMVDLLKTSAQVTVTVIPPTNDGNPRRYRILNYLIPVFRACNRFLIISQIKSNTQLSLINLYVAFIYSIYILNLIK